MIRFYNPFAFETGFLFLLIFYSCQQANPWKSEAEALQHQSAELDVAHIKLNERIDSLWDATTEVIAKDLPADFPPVDRDIFLHCRNADHIRMFMSFKRLSPEVQSTVDVAAQLDAMLAVQARDLQIRRDQFQQEKNHFLIKVADQDPKAGKRYAEQFIAITTCEN